MRIACGKCGEHFHDGPDEELHGLETSAAAKFARHPCAIATASRVAAAAASSSSSARAPPLGPR